MSVPTLAELYAEKTADDVLAVFLEAATTVSLPVTAWQPAEPGREFIEVISEMIASFTAGSSEAAASKLLSYATGDWLTLTCSEVFDTERTPATFGTCVERLTNVLGFAIPTITAGDLHFYNPDTGATYTNTSGGVLGAVIGATLDLDIQADESGTDSNAEVNSITQFVTPITGVTVTNTTACVGSDEQSDVSLVQTAREGNARLSPNGPPDAYNYFAKQTLRPDGTNVGVTRTKIFEPVSARGVVVLYVASSSGDVPALDVGYVQTNLLENVVPTGFTVTTVSATENSIDVRATIYLARGSTASSTTTIDSVIAQLDAYFTSVQIGGIELIVGGGGFVFLDAIIAQIFEASDQIVQAVVTSHSSDILLAVNEVPVLASTASSFVVAYAVN